MGQGAIVAITGGVVAIGGFLLARRAEQPTCPPGFTWDTERGVCLEIGVPPTCPTGFTWDPVNAVCLQNALCGAGYTPICVAVGVQGIPPPPPAGSIVSVTIIPVNVPTDTLYILDWDDTTNQGWPASPAAPISEGKRVYFPQVRVPGRLRTYKQIPGNWVHAFDGPANWSVADGTTWVWNMANPLAAPEYVPPA